MKRKKFVSIFIVINLLLLSGCIIGLVRNPSRIDDWYSSPREGTAYKYAYYFYWNGNLESYDEFTDTVVDINNSTDITSVAFHSKNGYSYHQINQIDNCIYIWYSDSWNSDHSSLDNNEDMILLKAPVEIGTKWSDYYNTYEISEIDAEEEFAIGKYDDIIVVESTSDDFYGAYYYSPSIGREIYWLEISETVTGDTAISVYELTSIE
ncbi:MAG: hypothetical protein R6U31_07805 [bacterium]